MPGGVAAPSLASNRTARRSPMKQIRAQPVKPLALSPPVNSGHVGGRHSESARQQNVRDVRAPTATATANKGMRADRPAVPKVTPLTLSPPPPRSTSKSTQDLEPVYEGQELLTEPETISLAQVGNLRAQRDQLEHIAKTQGQLLADQRAHVEYVALETVNTLLCRLQVHVHYTDRGIGAWGAGGWWMHNPMCAHRAQCSHTRKLSCAPVRVC